MVENLMVGMHPANPGMMVRFCADQPGVSVVKVDPALSYVKLEELVVGIIDQTTPAGFMKVI
jgi:hypothetical protein